LSKQLTELFVLFGTAQSAISYTGECEMMGDDVGGIAVHIGARVASLAGAGEVLVSSTVKDLVAGSGLRFGDRGSKSLKGIPEGVYSQSTGEKLDALPPRVFWRAPRTFRSA
jgi:class 3 adenylate cyclase